MPRFLYDSWVSCLLTYKQVYLRRFGHIDKGPTEHVTDEDLERGLRSIQDFAGLTVTGKYIQKALKEFKPQVVVNQARAYEVYLVWVPL